MREMRHESDAFRQEDVVFGDLDVVDVRSLRAAAAAVVAVAETVVARAVVPVLAAGAVIATIPIIVRIATVPRPIGQDSFGFAMKVIASFASVSIS